MSGNKPLPDGAYVRGMLAAIGIAEQSRVNLDVARMLEAARAIQASPVPDGMPVPLAAAVLDERALTVELFKRFEALLAAHDKWKAANKRSGALLEELKGKGVAAEIQSEMTKRAKDALDHEREGDGRLN